MLRLITLLVLGFSVQAIAESTSDKQRILDLFADWQNAVNTSSVSDIVAVLDPEIRLIPPGANVVDSAASYEAFLAPVFESATCFLEVVAPLRVDIQGDVAVAEYEYVVHLNLKDPDIGITEPGALTASLTHNRYFDVLRKNAESQWLVWRHAWQVVD